MEGSSGATRPELPPAPPSSQSAASVAEASGLAVAALVFGILSFFFPIICSLIAVGLGIAARIRIKASQGRLRGLGQANAGIILGVVSGLLVALAIWAIYAECTRNPTCFT
jgi:hypothetical protein